jgi:hypothetical protein
MNSRFKVGDSVVSDYGMTKGVVAGFSEHYDKWVVVSTGENSNVCLPESSLTKIPGTVRFKVGDRVVIKDSNLPGRIMSTNPGLRFPYYIKHDQSDTFLPYGDDEIEWIPDDDTAEINAASEAENDGSTPSFMSSEDLSLIYAMASLQKAIQEHTAVTAEQREEAGKVFKRLIVAVSLAAYKGMVK